MEYEEYIDSGKKYLYNKILSLGQLSNKELDSLKKYSYSVELESLFGKYNLSVELKTQIGAFYSLCKEVLITKSSVIMNPLDINSYLLEKDKYRILSTELSEIALKLTIKQKRRSKIIGKVYNYETNKLEYELEDGIFVEIDGDKLIRPKLELDKTIFPDCWLYVSGDIASLRDKRIDNILDDNNT